MIQRQSYELIRERIGQILATEWPQVMSDSNSLPNGDPDKLNFDEPTIFDERVTVFDQTELPAINVIMNSGEYDARDLTQEDGTYQFYIDCYTKFGETTGKTATKDVQRIAGICRAILMKPEYVALNMQGLVAYRMVSRIQISVPNPTNDAKKIAQARITFDVKAPETITLKEPQLFKENYTQVKLHETDKGYFWKLIIT